MQSIDINDVIKTIQGTAVGPTCGSITSICTDTRKLIPGALFFALKGENTDGHIYVKNALNAGALAVVVEKEIPDLSGTQLIVPDALHALGVLASYYRSRFHIPMIGLTGSVGKTSTREMIACALSSRYKTHSNAKNYNNEIGVPLTLFGLEEKHQAGVLEMAMRGKGQIASLAQMVKPTVGIITNIGLSHIEILGSRDEIAQAKSELLEYLPDDGFVALNAEDDYFDLLSMKAPCRVVSYGIEKRTDLCASGITFRNGGEPSFMINGRPINLRIPGVHHIINATAACAVAVSLGVSVEESIEALEEYDAPEMRLQVLHTPFEHTVLNDTYNAAPDSMRSALETLRVIGRGKGRTVAILGDMKELGDRSEAAHRYVGEMAGACCTGPVITVGDDSLHISRSAATILGSDQVVHFTSMAEAMEQIPALLHNGDIVLIKGSRAMQMERLLDIL